MLRWRKNGGVLNWRDQRILSWLQSIPQRLRPIVPKHLPRFRVHHRRLLLLHLVVILRRCLPRGALDQPNQIFDELLTSLPLPIRTIVRRAFAHMTGVRDVPVRSSCRYLVYFPSLGSWSTIRSVDIRTMKARWLSLILRPDILPFRSPRHQREQCANNRKDVLLFDQGLNDVIA